MKYPRIQLSFGRYTNDKLLALVEKVITNLTKRKEEYAKEVQDYLPILETSFRKFKTLNDATANRGAAEIQARNAYRPTFQGIVNTLARTLNTLYEGNGEMLSGLGFVVLQGPGKNDLGETINPIITQNGVKGYLQIDVKEADNAGAYQAYYTHDKDEDPRKWYDKVSLKRKFSIGKFDFNTAVYVKVVAYGNDDASVESTVTKWSIT